MKIWSCTNKRMDVWNGCYGRLSQLAFLFNKIIEAFVRVLEDVLRTSADISGVQGEKIDRYGLE